MPVVNSSATHGSWSPGALLKPARAFSPLPGYAWMHLSRQTSNSAILAPGSKAFRHFWKGSYSCFRPLTMLMVRADFDLTFCKSDFFFLFSEFSAKGAEASLEFRLKATE